MTTKTALTLDDVLATFEARKAAIAARPVPRLNYVLFWDNGLCVGVNPDTKKGFAAGFEHAAFFGDREAAAAWQRRYRIRNGRGEEPRPVLAFNEQQRAIAELEGHISTVAAQMKEA